MRKLILLSLGFVLMAINAQAQQEPLFAQYTSNAFLINPAVAGSKGNHSISLFHRWQWVSFPGAPMTYGLTYQGNIKDLHGIGALIFGDITGPTRRWGGKVSYAFHIPLADRKYRLSIGVGGRLVRNEIRANAIRFLEANDQAVANMQDGAWGGDAEFGLYFYAKNFYVGFSMPNLIQTKINFGNDTGLRDPMGHTYRHYFLTGGYKFSFPEKGISVEPSIMLKYVQGAGPQIDAGVKVGVLHDQIIFGLFYRSPSFLSFQAQILFDKKIPLLLGFDVALSNFQKYSVGATEVMIGYEFPSKTNMFGEKVTDNETTTPSTGDGKL